MLPQLSASGTGAREPSRLSRVDTTNSSAPLVGQSLRVVQAPMSALASGRLEAIRRLPATPLKHTQGLRPAMRVLWRQRILRITTRSLAGSVLLRRSATSLAETGGALLPQPLRMNVTTSAIC